MNITELKDKLFQQYPSSDLNLDGLRQCQKERYEQYTDTVGKIASAVTLNDVRVFEDAAKEYQFIFEELKEVGFCHSENRRQKRQKEKDDIKIRIEWIAGDLDNIEGRILTLTKQLTKSKERKIEREAELKEWEAKLKEIGG